MNQISKYVFEIALIVGAALLAFSQYRTSNIVTSVTVIAVFFASASRITPALLRLQSAFLSIRSSSGIAQPTLDLAAELFASFGSQRLDYEVSTRIRMNPKAIHMGFSPDVEVRNSVLSYPGAERAALANVTLSVPAGTSLALVGPTGAGKSSLVDLILGVLEPDAGSVLIGGVSPLKAVAQYPGAVAYVPQDIAVIDGTVRANVALGLPPELVDDEQVWQSLAKAQLQGFLQQEREGLDTVVGEHGVRLSGGQRQRLGLARALYTNPYLLVLDEATSALDAETELAVSQALDAMDREVTRIIVAHRLATIRHCDQVAYLDHGRVIAIGTFEEVRAIVPGFDRQAQLLGL